MLSLVGLFNRIMKELVEMNYQSEYPYLFDSSKFNKAFGYTPTSYADGIEETAQWALNNNK
jgi:nucleoside-diphosphate-sugar epimerase